MSKEQSKVAEIVAGLSQYHNGKAKWLSAEEAAQAIEALIADKCREAVVAELEKIQVLDDGRRQLANVMLETQIYIKDRIATLKNNKPEGLK